MKLFRPYIIYVLIFISLQISAQTSCLNTLREAKQLYEEGLIDEIPDLLSGCMEDGFTRAQRVEAYKLIILAYLFDDDQFAAEKTMDEFLRKFPEYEVMPNDPVEFVYLLESYKTSSVYTLNFTFGPTFGNQRITEHYSAIDATNATFKSTTSAGFHIGLGVSRAIWKSVYGNIGVFYSTVSYASLETGRSIFEEEGSNQGSQSVEYIDISANEQVRKIDVPLTATYSFGQGNLNYLVRIGAMVSFSNSASISVVREHPQSDAINLNDIDITENRASVGYSLIAGAGLEYKIPRGFLVLDVRYHYGLNDMVISENRYDSQRFITRGAYIDDDFKLDYVSVAIGYHFSIYQSRKNRY